MSLERRFWEKVDRRDPDECWPWHGAKVNGYGHIWSGGRMQKASRVALELTLKRALGVAELALHSCDNPPCCNPAHLRAGTNSDNTRDMVERGRHPKQMRPRTHCRQGHLLADDNVFIAAATGARRCRRCKSAFEHKRGLDPDYRRKSAEHKRLVRSMPPGAEPEAVPPASGSRRLGL
jgi:hypothetical protein